MAKAAALRKVDARGSVETLSDRETGRALVASEEELSALEAGAAITTFLKGMARFFTDAKEIEDAAKATLTRARALTLPRTGEEDDTLQQFARNVTSEKRGAEAHWKITATVAGFHKRLTGRRAIATGALDEASKIANELHNRYVDQERRRAAEAQEKIRREAEEKAREDRARELAAAEAEAVKREEASPDLSDREEAFVNLYCTGAPSMRGNAQRCAQAAGYKDPLKTAVRLTSLGKIQKAIQAREQAAAIREQAAARLAEPLEVDVPTIEADVTTKGNRSTPSAEILDEQALIAAVIAGKHGIPSDILTVKPARLNDYARSLGNRIELWPGVRFKSTTRIV